MKKTFAAFLAIATIAGSLSVTPASAQRGVAAGVAAGLIGGAIVGGAIASSRPPYGGPVYVEEAPPAPRRSPVHCVPPPDFSLFVRGRRGRVPTHRW